MRTILLASALSAIIMSVQAQDISHRIEVAPGRATLWTLNGAQLKNVVVGDPQIADALPGVTDNELVVMSKKPGSTNFLILDDNGEVVANLGVSVTGPARDPYRVHIHTKLDNLHAYWAYSCQPNEGCHRVDDPLEGSDRVPPPRSVTVINAPLNAPSTTVTPPAPAPKSP